MPEPCAYCGAPSDGGRHLTEPSCLACRWKGYERIPTQHGERVYRLRNTDRSGRELGPCQVCGLPVAEVWMQSSDIAVDRGDGVLRRLDGGESCVGHRDCLIGVRSA